MRAGADSREPAASTDFRARREQDRLAQVAFTLILEDSTSPICSKAGEVEDAKLRAAVEASAIFSLISLPAADAVLRPRTMGPIRAPISNTRSTHPSGHRSAAA